MMFEDDARVPLLSKLGFKEVIPKPAVVADTDAAAASLANATEQLSLHGGSANGELWGGGLGWLVGMV